MYNAKKTQVNTRSEDMHMDMVIVGCLLFKNIDPTKMVRMKVPIIYKEDDCWGHKWVIDNDPKVI
jgi:hypothetical protein